MFSRCIGYYSPVFLLLYSQLAVICIATILLWFFLNWTASYSGFLGGMISWVSTIYFAYKFFKFNGAKSAQLIVKSFYTGEAGKLLLTTGLFILLFVWVKPLNGLAVFSVFLLVQSVFWFVPLILNKSFRT